MRKIIIALLTGIILLIFSSCETVDMNYSYTIKDALKISTWVLAENIDENGYWMESESIVGHGYWVESTERIIDSNKNDVFMFEQLKLNKVRMMAPFNYMLMPNLNIHCAFDGIIEIATEDEYMLLGYNSDNPSQPGGMGDYKNVRMPYEIYVTVCPLNEHISEGHRIVRSAIKKTDREYYLNVNAYNFDNEETPIIKVRLKLLVLEDNSFSSSYAALSNSEDSSRFMSVELISYEYSDRYILLDELWDDEEYDWE